MEIDLQTTLVSIAYIIAAILFIVGLKGLSHPRTAVRGNLLGAIGMFIAIVVTLLDQKIIGFAGIIAGSVVGTTIGAALAIKIKMTAMPQLVALFNGFGGGASVLVAGAALIEALLITPDPLIQTTVAAAASGLIGSVTLLGSLVAFGKLQGLISEAAVQFSGQKTLIILSATAALFLAGWLVSDPAFMGAYWALVAIASLLGVVLVIGIGGADMPVVISLLNSYSGLAAAATGFVLENSILIIAGSLVGTAGLILTNLMCKAMNRSLSNVLFGGVGAAAITSPGKTEDDVYAGRVKSASADDVAMLLETARRVVIVPGYGLAVAQAQHAVRDLGNLLESKGVEVEFAIHPVAGRMPGHMNVLLAEADIAYDKLKEMDLINPTFAQTDVAIVIGANDVVNPVARNSNDPSNPIAGMPILDVDKAQAVVVIKRSLSPGFAGIANPLFAADNTLMLFGDGKKAVLELITALGQI
ncbi:NAD(P)(+) transhydrogenase (Re/Si-specific) subunit beta [Candidatus Acetothermia bacterium]|jgi:NAD(P) transhydrogenase subunit beta|nr:NAD(P)(+) transhydrogenase (Re/Si-specific) subunit beta [Candidatus Acetothermia bacterium]MCI2427809.1 NAD(P)(+) transhydrogenase (Re/Si-specific) subunit beta [Candidatus Acetothermia bacterium]MCI2428327.1 NAD(P)(+) transhydrogenase (Re/Si-specific) subunit beta [Candidatus Acetothermia bacterium]